MSDTPETTITDWSAEKAHEGHVKLAALVNTLETQRDEARAEVERLRKRVEELEAHPAFVVDMQTGKFTPLLSTPTQPEIFEAHGREWYRHTPGDKMPCDGKTFVQNLMQREKKGGWFNANVREACEVGWGIWGAPEFNTVGWRPADAPEKLPKLQDC